MRIGFGLFPRTFVRAHKISAKTNSNRLIRNAVAKLPPARALAPLFSAARLTEREMQVLLHVAKGAANKEIAQILKIGLKTVETHRENLMESTGRHSVGALVHLAVQMGMDIKPENFEKLPKFTREAFDAEEINVLHLVAIGKSTKEIAAILKAKDRHIADVRGKLMRKTQRPNPALLAQLAIEMGLVQLGNLEVPKELAA